ncbi:MAG: beta-galactosidase [Planctomycetes bacterium]|nr:beta-galactosidase [Planctomycetota bacterium]
MRHLMQHKFFIQTNQLFFIFLFAYCHQSAIANLNLKKSDIVALYPIEKELGAEYYQTVSGWGWDLAWWYKSFEDLAEINQSGGDKGLRIVSMNIELSSATAKVLYENPKLQEAVLRDVENKPIRVPWFKPWTFKGVETLWGCFHHPDYRAHVISKVLKGLKTNANALHFDMPCGSSRFEYGGCYCHYCGEEFKSYLRQKYSIAELKHKGLSDIESYNYRLAVQAVVPTKEDSINAYFKGEPMPFRYEYETFQRHAAGKFIKELGVLVKKVAGPNAPVTANAWRMTPATLATCLYSDFFVAELNHCEGSPEIKADVPLAYKLADALGKSLAAFGDGPDYHFIESNRAEPLIKSWIAMAYALGHQHLIPYGQWVITPNGEQKNKVFNGDVKVFGPLYKFIHENSNLFDGYESYAQVGLLYSSMGIRRGHRDIYDACEELLDANIPFELIVAGDDWITETLNLSDIRKNDVLLVAGPHELYDEQKDVIESAFDHNIAVEYKGAKTVEKQIKPVCALANAKEIWLLPRIKTKNTSSSLAIHLYNKSLNLENYEAIVKKDVQVSIRKDTFKIGNANKVLFHSPGQPSINVKVIDAGDYLTFEVPELQLWGILDIPEVH